MRLVEVLQLTTAIMAVHAGMFSSIEKKTVGHFKRSKAISPDTAIELPPLKKFARWRISRLKSLGAIISTETGRLYLNKAVYSSIRKKRALIAISFVIVTITSVVLIYKLF